MSPLLLRLPRHQLLLQLRHRRLGHQHLLRDVATHGGGLGLRRRRALLHFSPRSLLLRFAGFVGCAEAMSNKLQ